MKDVRVISFDLDDTFWDCAPAIAHAERSLFRWHQEHTPRIAQAHDEASLLSYRIEVRRQHPELAGCVTAMRLKGLTLLLAEFDYPQSLAAEAFEVFYKARSQVVIYPKVTDLLTALGSRYKIAAITNGNADLERIGIATYFDQIYAADLDMKAKPDADMFLRCATHFDVDICEMLHVGDNPVTDIEGAMNAGAKTLWFNQHGVSWPHESYQPDFEAQSIEHMMEIFS